MSNNNAYLWVHFNPEGSKSFCIQNRDGVKIHVSSPDANSVVSQEFPLGWEIRLASTAFSFRTLQEIKGNKGTWSEPLPRAYILLHRG